jgi:hypothetical protein
MEEEKGDWLCCVEVFVQKGKGCLLANDKSVPWAKEDVSYVRV